LTPPLGLRNTQGYPIADYGLRPENGIRISFRIPKSPIGTFRNRQCICDSREVPTELDTRITASYSTVRAVKPISPEVSRWLRKRLESCTPHITLDDGVCGGSAVIAGTRFPVRMVVFYVLQLGYVPKELIERFPHVTLAQIYDALAYYYDNRLEIEADMAANREDAVRTTRSRDQRLSRRL